MSRRLLTLLSCGSVVRLAWSDDGLWFATISYDKTICIYEAVPTATSDGAADALDSDEFANTPTFKYYLRWQKTVPTNPEACTFTPDSKYFIFTRREDNFLYYVALPAHTARPELNYTDKEFSISRINLNENDDSHISFSV